MGEGTRNYRPLEVSRQRSANTLPTIKGEEKSALEVAPVPTLGLQELIKELEKYNSPRQFKNSEEALFCSIQEVASLLANNLPEGHPLRKFVERKLINGIELDFFIKGTESHLDINLSKYRFIQGLLNELVGLFERMIQVELVGTNDKEDVQDKLHTLLKLANNILGEKTQIQKLLDKHFSNNSTPTKENLLTDFPPVLSRFKELLPKVHGLISLYKELDTFVKGVEANKSALKIPIPIDYRFKKISPQQKVFSGIMPAAGLGVAVLSAILYTFFNPSPIAADLERATQSSQNKPVPAIVIDPPPPKSYPSQSSSPWLDRRPGSNEYFTSGIAIVLAVIACSAAVISGKNKSD